MASGHLKLSLVTCPVSLYTAIDAGGDVHFHLINPETHNRVRMIATDPDTAPVERSDLVKGFEVAKDEYVLLSDEDIRAVRLESTRTIGIDRFVPADEIDRLYWDNPYYPAPDGKLAQMPMRPLFFVIALATTGLAIAACKKKADENPAAPTLAAPDGTGTSSTSGETAPPQPNPNGGDTTLSPGSSGVTSQPGPPPMDTPSQTAPH